MKISAEMTFVPRPQINSNRNSGMENIGSREREREDEFVRGHCRFCRGSRKRLRECRAYSNSDRLSAAPWRRENGAVSFHLARRCVEISGNNELPHPVIAPRNRNPIRCF